MVVTADTDSERSENPLSGLNVAIVEDHPDVRGRLEVAIEIDAGEEGSVLAFERADALLSHIQKSGIEGIDVLITDWRMKGKDGLQLAREIREIAPQLPIVLLTSAHSTVLPIEEIQALRVVVVEKDMHLLDGITQGVIEAIQLVEA